MKPKIYLNFSCGESTLVDDIKYNFTNSKAFDYLINYNQSNTRNYSKLLKDDCVDLEDMEKEYIKEVSTKGYSSQTFTFNFRKDIQNDNEALKDLVYLDDLQYYFTASYFFIDGYIESEKEIDGKIWTNKEVLEYLSVSKYNGILNESDIDDFLSEIGINRDDYTLIYNLSEINY